jgi:protein involved in polysaccharide export with SLBB domain
MKDMDGTAILEGSTSRKSAGLATAFVLAAAIAAGCAPDTRISMAEFLDMQRATANQQQAIVREQAPPDLTAKLGPYAVGSGDVLLVSIRRPGGEAPDVPLQARIDRNGQVDLPIAGKVSVANKELEDVEDLIQAAYVPAVYREAIVHVELLAADPVEVLLFGAVTEPGLIPLRRTERNLLYAIQGAGGITELASGEVTLRRIRRPTEEVTLDLTDAVELQAALHLEPLQNGDIIYVHAARPNTVFVGGLVARAAPQEYPAGANINILQAIAAAGGLRTDLTPREGTLIRRMPDGTDVHVKLDMDRLAMGSDPNIELVPGDILWVPHTLETRVQEFVNRNIFMRAGVSVNYSVSGIEFMNRHELQSGRYGGSLEDAYDPFGFLGQNAALYDITRYTAP